MLARKEKEMQQQQVSRKSTVLGAILEIIIPGLGILEKFAYFKARH